MTQLFAIVLEETGEMLWGGMSGREHAESTAARLGNQLGAVRLLRGRELGEHLLGGSRRLSPVHALGETWRPGERVEHARPGKPPRPGTVERIEREYGYHEHLVVKFDDSARSGAINPDVMRHRREEENA